MLLQENNPYQAITTIVIVSLYHSNSVYLFIVMFNVGEHPQNKLVPLLGGHLEHWELEQKDPGTSPTSAFFSLLLLMRQKRPQSYHVTEKLQTPLSELTSLSRNLLRVNVCAFFLCETMFSICILLALDYMKYSLQMSVYYLLV